MEKEDEVDVFVKDVGEKYLIFSISFGRPRNRPNIGSQTQTDFPLKAVKLGLRLPSYIRSLENPTNSHDTCKIRM